MHSDIRKTLHLS